MTARDPIPPGGHDHAAVPDVENDVMAKCIDAFHEGGDAAVAAVLAVHPAMAERLRARLDKLRRAGLLGDGLADGVGADAAPERLGEFKLLRRLGSGGMGVVFLAEQLTLGRQVAVKILRPEQRFFPGAQARFRREIEAVARLGDPGIVPIYSVGEDQGVDYFVMEYVRGIPLGDAIVAMHRRQAAQRSGRALAEAAAAGAGVPMPETLPEVFHGTWEQTACRIVARMARATQHAHERGVVHRDIKPNNAMVTPDGRVLLLDFGLAAASGASRITRSGALLGTLHYMAPEQLQDGDTDARTDVYALGVTLHELLALASPFAADSEQRLRECILTGASTPLREHNPEVPREVQTIAAVAMDRDPARRYATAQALADDLERFLHHRPIQARPIGRWLRAVRWSQRHPAWATACLLTMAAMAATPLVVQWSRGHAAVEIASAKEQARTNLGSAVAAIDGILKGISSQSMSLAPVLDADHRRQLDEAVALVRRLLAENADDRAVLELFLGAMRRVANVRSLVGQHQAALDALDEAEAAVVKVRRQTGDPRALAMEFAGLRLGRGTALRQLGRFEESGACWQQVIDEYDATPLATMADDLATTLFACHNNLAGAPWVRRDPDRALRHLHRSLELEAHVFPNGLPPDRVVENVRTLTNIAMLEIDKGDSDAARRTLATVLERVQAALRGMPEDGELLRAEARAHWCIGRALAVQKDRPGAVRERERAVALMQVQAQRFPKRLSYRNDVATMTADLAVDREAAGDSQGAEAAVLEAIAATDTLIAAEPTSLDYPRQLARQLRQLARLQFDSGRVEASLATVTRAIDVMTAVVDQGGAFGHCELAELLLRRGAHHVNDEAWEDARTDLRRGRDQYEAALAAGLPVAEAPRFSPLLLLLARAELVFDDAAAAVAAIARAQQVHPVGAAMLRQVGEEFRVLDREDFQALLRQAPAK